MADGDSNFGSLPTIQSTINPAAETRTLNSQQTDSNVMGNALINASVNQGKDINKLNDNVRVTHDRFNMALDGLLGQVDGARSTINDSYDKLETARLVPRGIGHILSIFGNTDYDRDFQKMRIDRASTNLELANQSVKTLATAASSAEQSATFARQGLATATDASIALAGNERANAASKIQLQAEAEHQAQRVVEGMSDDQLAMAQKNPSLVTRQNPAITPGMIQTVATNRQSANQALATARTLYDTANVSNKEAHMDLVNHQVSQFINYMSQDDFAAAQKQSATTGSFQLDLDTGKAATPQSVHVIGVPDQTFQTVARTRAEATVKHEKEMSDYTTAAVQTPIRAEEVANKYDRIAANPAAMKYAAADDISAIRQGYGVYKALENDTSPGSVFQKRNVVDDITKRVDGIVAAAVDNAPKDAQPGTKQFIQTGKIADGDAATGVLSTSTLNVNSPFSLEKTKQFGVAGSRFSTGDMYQSGDQLIRTELQRVRESANYPLKGLFSSGSGQGGTNARLAAIGSIPKEKPSDKDLFEQVAASETGTKAKASVVKGLQELALHNAILQLGSDYPDRPGIAAFKGLLYGNEISGAYRDAQGNIDPHAIFAALYQKDVSDPTHAQKNIETLFGKLNDPDYRDTFAKYEAQVNNTTEHAAYRQLWFHNDIQHEVVSPLVNALRQYQGQVRDNPAIAGVSYPAPPRRVAPFLGRKGVIGNENDSLLPEGSMPDLKRFPFHVDATKYNPTGR